MNKLSEENSHEQVQKSNSKMGGILCLLGTVPIYACYRINGRKVNFYKSITRVNQLQDLARIYRRRDKFYPLIVTGSGRADSDTPINYKNGHSMCVLKNEKAVRNFMIRKEFTGWEDEKPRKYKKWKNVQVQIAATTEEVPWYLDDGTDRAHVDIDINKTGLDLEVVEQTFKEARRSFAGETWVGETWDDLRNFKHLLSKKNVKDVKMLGVTTTVRVLPIGKSLTFVGEAVEDDTGMIRIRKPENGEFHLFSGSIDQYFQKYLRVASACKVFGVGLAVLGVLLIGKEANF